MDGKCEYNPHLAEDPRPDPQPVEWGFTYENWKICIRRMYGVVNEGGGTGVRAQLPHIEGVWEDGGPRSSPPTIS